jgi:putative hydrolase of the HAD superfamily
MRPTIFLHCRACLGAIFSHFVLFPRMQLPDFDWIFFDCFNTLIDDFDPRGEEGSLLDIPEMAVECGYFPDAAAFREAYSKVRAQTLRHGREIPLYERLRQTLQASTKAHTREEAVASVNKYLAKWEQDYTAILRPTPGVEAMLNHWYQRRALAVVTNAYLPGFAQRQLERFGLARYFRFVVDSATTGFKKPNPLLSMEALSLASMGPCDGNRVICVGDRCDIDVASADELGMHALHFNRSNSRPGVETTPTGILVVHDWAEFR